MTDARTADPALVPPHQDTLHPAVFSTRITQLFGIRHPVLCGGLMWLSDASYVAGIVNAGGMGFMTSRSFPTLENFTAEMEACATLTDGKPFGVNLSTSRHASLPLEAYLHAALDRGVRFFETSGRAPADGLIATIHAAGGVVIHKVPLVRHARTAERLGVDAVTIVGSECGGHPGINTEVPAMMGGAIAASCLRIPFAIGGGIGTGRQLLAALALGADAVVMGTRFLAAEEVTAHDACKQRVIAADESSSVVVFADNVPLGGAWRVMDNATVQEVRRREAAGLRHYADFSDLLAGSLTAQRCYRQGDTESGMVSMGPAACFVQRIEPMREIVNNVIAEAASFRNRLSGMSAGRG
jgi:nitronate monooxygenase